MKCNRYRVMDAYTYELLVAKYYLLTSRHRSRVRFDGLEEFIAEFEGQRADPGPDDEPYDYRVCRIEDELEFEPGNVYLTHIDGPNKLASCLAPAV